MKLKLKVLPNRLAICRVNTKSDFPNWAVNDIFVQITQTEDEISIVTLENKVIPGVKCDTGWRALKVLGPLDLALFGITASLTQPLAREKINIFATATYDTDYILVKEEQLEKAKVVLEQEGFIFVD